MKLLVVARDPRLGTPARKTVTADWVRVGRHASSEIYLADPRVALAQGMIVWREGLVYIEGEAGVMGRGTTHKAVRSVRLKRGEPIEVGPYRIEPVEAPPGYDGAVSVELAHPLQSTPGLASRASRLTLASLGLSKRPIAWLAFVLVLALFLLIPAGRVLHLPWDGAAQRIGATDRLWDPGPVMLAHQPIGGKCAACHEVAFRQVRDTACLECHAKTARHDGGGLEHASLFEGSRCGSCHVEHQGAKATYRDDDDFCIACHRDIKAKAPDAQSRNVSDFALDHPAFRVSLRDGEATRRVRMTGAAVSERTGLKFPHDKHLDPKGVKSPAKGRVKLECASCHASDASARSFVPVTFEKRCQECHSLQFEPAVTAREVPHGKPADAVTVIDEFYANLALKGTPDSFQRAFGVPGEGLLRRVGSPSDDQRRNALAIAGGKARSVAIDLFEVRACRQCHDVTRKGAKAAAPGWDIAPVRAAVPRMPHARFDHKAHGTVKCADCHDVSHSKRASELAMPPIAKCRECHAGAKPVEAKLTSNCMLCHGFHDGDKPWLPGFTPRGRERVALGLRDHAR